MKKHWLIYILVLLSNVGFSQTKNYPHCNCIESLSEAGEYNLNCNGILMEEGQFKDGKRTGNWITRNTKGTTIIDANYTEDRLDGSYTQYHFKGKPKLQANFKNNVPDGNWTYFNDKGRVIKEGQYSNGKPVGNWKVFDKKGKKVDTEYNFDNGQLNTTGVGIRYFKGNGGIARDDASGEWMVLHFPERNISAKVEPLGGYLLTADMFLDYLNIPPMYMNTYAHHEFVAILEVVGEKVLVKEVTVKDAGDSFDSTAPSFPFIVQTNSPNKLTRTAHSKASLELLKGRIKDVVTLTGPWIQNGNLKSFDIQIPFVLNEIQR